MRRRRRGLSPGTRLFLVFAAASLVPMVVLSLVLNATVRSNAMSRTQADAQSQAQLLAETAVAPALYTQNLEHELGTAPMADLGASVTSSTREGRVLRLLVHAPSGRVVYPPDKAGPDQASAASVAAALDGRSTARLTRTQPPGQNRTVQAVRVFTAIDAPATHRRIGVLEVYLPYAAVAGVVNQQTHRLNILLTAGLLALYLIVAGISWVVTGRLRRQAVAHEYSANHDHLTGLPNRALFRERAADAVADARRRGSSCAVVVVDLDRFKEVNDTLGHHTGDLLLRQVADRLTESLRTDDTVARLGGDEFGLVLPGTSAAAAMPVVAAARERVAAEMPLAGLTISVGSSMGVAAFPADGGDVDVLLQHADIAMYQAKTGQRGAVAYRPGVAGPDPERLGVGADLRRGVEQGELVLHYQPQVRLRSGSVASVEALVRWQHPTKGLLYPDSFIEIAEQEDVIDALTTWVLTEALAQLGRWDAAGGPPLAVAVNISARTMQDANFPAAVAGLLAAAGQPAGRLLLEVTETALVADPEAVRRVLEELAGLGLALSLDDFGRGYTSLAHLRGLPLTELKIDKSFVLGMDRSERDIAIVRSVVQLAHALGLTVVAEGVEHAHLLAALVAMGCDTGQGYHISRPLPADAMLPWLATWPTSSALAGAPAAAVAVAT